MTPGFCLPTSVETLCASFPQRLKALRHARRLSLEEVARRAGVTKAFLSLLERGKNIPSAATLEGLAAALGVPVASLFPDEAAAPVRVSLVRRDERVAEPIAAYTTLNLLDPLFAYHEVNPFIIACDRKSFTPQTTTVVGEQFIYMLEGSLDYLCDEVQYTLRPGDALYFNATIPHGPQKMHTRRAEYLTCFVMEAYAWFDMRVHYRSGGALPPHVPSARPLAERLARKVRMVRYTRFEQLETVSARAGLKVSTVQAIEEGRVNPSAVTLLRLAHAFNLPLQYFLEPTEYPHQAYFATAEARRRSVEAAGRGEERYALAQPLGMPLFFMPELRVYHAGRELPPCRSFSGQFFVFIVEGRCQFRCGEREEVLEAGDALAGYAHDVHGVTRVLTPSVTLLHIASDLAGMVATALERVR